MPSQITTRLLFSKIRPMTPAGLPERILVAIAAERARQAAVRARLASWSAGLWLITFLTSAVFVGRSLVTSEFWQLASLAFTDFSLALAYSEDFLVSLMETFPAVSAVTIIAPLFLYVLSLILRSKYAGVLLDSKYQFQASHSH